MATGISDTSTRLSRNHFGRAVLPIHPISQGALAGGDGKITDTLMVEGNEPGTELTVKSTLYATEHSAVDGGLAAAPDDAVAFVSVGDATLFCMRADVQAMYDRGVVMVEISSAGVQIGRWEMAARRVSDVQQAMSAEGWHLTLRKASSGSSRWVGTAYRRSNWVKTL